MRSARDLHGIYGSKALSSLIGTCFAGRYVGFDLQSAGQGGMTTSYEKHSFNEVDERKRNLKGEDINSVGIYVLESFSAEETQNIAGKLAEKAEPGAVYALDGDLGAGKTAFTQGFARGLGVEDVVSSPTFTIVQEYESGRLPLYHFDVYRIADEDEMDEIGFDEYIAGCGVCLIEWSVRIDGLLPDYAIRVFIEKDMTKGEDYRKITVKGLPDERMFQ